MSKASWLFEKVFQPVILPISLHVYVCGCMLECQLCKHVLQAKLPPQTLTNKSLIVLTRDLCKINIQNVLVTRQIG